MSEANVESNNLPYRARIMMSTNADNNISNRTTFFNSKFSNIQNMKPLNARRDFRSINQINSQSTNQAYADLQPLQWLHQDAILSIAPIDNEEEFVPGKDDIVSISTSPVKVDVIAEEPRNDEVNGSMPNSTIADFYRYQAMRAAMAGGHTNGLRSSSHSNCQQPNEYQKPPFSYTHIIFMAIETSPNKAMTVNDIYVWCETHFPYYTQAGVGWKNSLRHNLSINKSFKKISRDGRGGPGRGAYWVVEPRERSNLIDAIRRSPCSLGGFPLLSSNAAAGQHVRTNTTAILTNPASLQRTTTSILQATAVQKAAPADQLASSINRGPLLRIGGQLTDASQLLNRSTSSSGPIIQRLRSTDSNGLIDLTNSAFPLIQLEPGFNFEAANCPLTSSGNFELQVIDDSEVRGKVVCHNQHCGELDPEVEHAFYEMFKNLTENDANTNNNNNDNGLGDIIRVNRDCPEHGGKKKKSGPSHKNITNNNSNNNIGNDSEVFEDSVPPDDVPKLTKEKKQCSMKLKRKCSCIRAVTDSDDSEVSYSNDDFSEMSDTDFNSKMNLGRRNRHKEKQRSILTNQSSSASINKSKSMISSHSSASIPAFNQSKSSANFRLASKSLQSKSRINSITRAPHSDHVYAFLQDFLLPVNLSEEKSQPSSNPGHNNLPLSSSHSLSSLSSSNTQGSLKDYNTRLHYSQSIFPNNSNAIAGASSGFNSNMNLDCNFYTQLSKRTKSKWQSIRELSHYNNAYTSSTTLHNSYTSANTQLPSHTNSSGPQDLTITTSTNKYQAMKQMKKSYEQIVENNHHTHFNFQQQHIHQYDNQGADDVNDDVVDDEDDEDEKEEQENRFVFSRSKQDHHLPPNPSCPSSSSSSSSVSVNSSISSTHTNRASRDNSSHANNSMGAVSRKRSVEENEGNNDMTRVVKRKVGRPKKSLTSLDDSCNSAGLKQSGNENISKFEQRIKQELRSRDILPVKYLKESNVNVVKYPEQEADIFSKKEEQAAIKILANLHRKTKQRQKTVTNQNQTKTQSANHSNSAYIH